MSGHVFQMNPAKSLSQFEQWQKELGDVFM